MYLTNHLFRPRAISAILIFCCLLTACGTPSANGTSFRETDAETPSSTEAMPDTYPPAVTEDTSDTEISSVAEDSPDAADSIEDYIAGIPSSLYAGELTKQKILALLATGEWSEMCGKGLESFLSYTNIYYAEETDTPGISRYFGLINDKDNNYGRIHDLTIYVRNEKDFVAEATAGSIVFMYLQEVDSWDYITLYSEDGYTPTPVEFNVFIRRLYDLTDYIRCELPEGYTTNNHWNEENFWNGWLLEGDEASEVFTLSRYVPWENCAAGGIGFFDNTFASVVEFQGDKIADIHFGGETTFPGEEWRPVDDCCLPAVLVEYDFLLFTDEDTWELYHSYHPEASWEDVGFSSYWYLFMAAPDVDTGYVVFLNKKYFSKEDAIALARSIVPKEGIVRSSGQL